MVFQITPPPNTGENKFDGVAWQRWFLNLARKVSESGQIAWAQVNKVGSNLTDLVTRNHNDLQNIQGGNPGDYQHLTTAQVSTATGTVAWSRVDKTGSNLTDLATHNHNDLANIQGGTTGDYQHLTTAQVALIGSGASQFPILVLGDPSGNQSVTYGSAGQPVPDFVTDSNGDLVYNMESI
jgi:hypothetical protein